MPLFCARAVSKGANALIDESLFPLAKEGTTYVAPQVLVDVDHSMKVMSDETFGPVMGIMKVRPSFARCRRAAELTFSSARRRSRTTPRRSSS